MYLGRGQSRKIVWQGPVKKICSKWYSSPLFFTYTDVTRLNQFALCKPLVRCAFCNVSFNCSQNTQHLAAPLMSIRIAHYEDMKYVFLITRTRGYETKVP